MKNNAVSLADAEVGKRYTVSVLEGGVITEVRITSKNESHTFAEHTNGKIAWPNNLPAYLINLIPVDDEQKNSDS